MAIVNKIICDLCKEEGKFQDMIAIQGNVCVVSNKDPSGVGGGIYGSPQWLEKISKNKSLVLEEVPINHFHIKCFHDFCKETLKDGANVKLR